MKLKLFVFLYLLAASIKSQTTCSLTASTNWTVATSWSCGHVPTGSDNIYIPYGYTVTITTVINLSTGNLTSMIIDGVLLFSGNTSRLDLPSTTTVNLTSNGLVTTNVNNNSQKFYIGNNPIWTSNNGSVTGPSIGTSTSGQLPIELLYFYGIPSGFDVILEWATVSEMDNDYFEIQSSEDGVNWLTIGKIIGNGNSQTLKNYTFLDYNPNIPTGYYRLKQVDYDGKFNFSGIIYVDFVRHNKKNSIIIAPNPIKQYDNINLILDGFDNEEVLLSIYNSYGSKFFEKLVILNGDKVVLPKINIPKGIYILTCVNNKESYIKKIIID